MKFARDLIDLMSAMPGRAFRMQELVNYIQSSHPRPIQRKESTREALRRVLAALEESGSVVVSRQRPSGRGGFKYEWKE